MTHDRITAEPIEDDRHELLNGPLYHFSPNRREFAAMVGAGIVVSVAVGRTTAGEFSNAPSQQQSRPTDLSDRIHIGENGVVTVLTGKVEVGQDARTQISQAAAEELGLTLDRIQIVMGDTELCPNDGGTFGSLTTPRTIPQIRAAAAVARKVLIELAATKIGAEPNLLQVADNQISLPGTDQSVSIGELAKDKNIEEHFSVNVDPGVRVQRVDQWQIMGTSPHKVGGEDVVTGTKKFPTDIVLPDMLYGKILRPPVFGAQLQSVDLDASKSIPGAVAVRDEQFVGCVAKSTFDAANAVRALAITAQWDQPNADTQVSDKNIYDYLKRHARPADSGRRRGGRSRGGTTARGSIEQGLAAASDTLEAKYEIAYIQHAPMEPRAAVAQWNDDKITVWTGTQNPVRVRGELMQAFRLPADKVRVIVPDTGGGFGGKHTGEVALEAARLAKQVGQPVSVCWTREEEFQWAYFRPAGLIEVKAGWDAAEKITAWQFTNYHSGGSSIGTPYEIPNVQCQAIRCDGPLRTGSYRALAATANNFARECFMDELASARGADSLEFRLEYLPASRLRNVLEIAARRFGWAERQKSLKPGQGIGLACGTEKASYVAACVAVEVDASNGKVTVHEVCQAFECGAVQNPTNLRAQIEGCLIMGLGGALTEEIHFGGGKILNGAFAKYLVPRMSHVPKLDTILVNRPELDSVGAGETPIIAIAPAIANAVYRATGVRVRSMPVRRDQLVKS